MNDVTMRRLATTAEKVLPWTGALYGAAAGLLVELVRSVTGWVAVDSSSAAWFATPFSFGFLCGVIGSVGWKNPGAHAAELGLFDGMQRRIGIFLWMLTFGLIGADGSARPILAGVVAGISLDVACTPWVRRACRKAFLSVFGGTTGRSGHTDE